MTRTPTAHPNPACVGSSKSSYRDFDSPARVGRSGIAGAGEGGRPARAGGGAAQSTRASGATARGSEPGGAMVDEPGIDVGEHGRSQAVRTGVGLERDVESAGA